MNVDQILSLCTGIGGLDLGLHAGLRSVGRSPRTVCMVEREAFCVSVLGKAIEKGRMDECPIWCGDLRDLPLGELPAIDWITGGYPCQPFSASGKRMGREDPRHLWPDILNAIRTLQPQGLFFENVAGHLTLGLDSILQDLERCGFRSAFGLFSAEEVGAPHGRERVFVLSLADPDRKRRRLWDTKRKDAEDAGKSPVSAWPSRPGEPSKLWESFRTTQPGLGRRTDGFPDRVDRLRAIGNAVCPVQAQTAFYTLWGQL